MDDGNVRINLHDTVSFCSLVVTQADAANFTIDKDYTVTLQAV